jgi:hypothetical protein
MRTPASGATTTDGKAGLVVVARTPPTRGGTHPPASHLPVNASGTPHPEPASAELARTNVETNRDHP